jgi:ketosteroid isomerase-like protein
VTSAKYDLVRRATDAYNRGDLEAFLAEWAPDVVVDWSRSHGLDARTFRGREAVLDFVKRFREPFAEIRIELDDEPVELEDGSLIVENVASFRGRDGIEAQARSAWLITFRDGVQSSLTMFQTKADALEAAAKAGS